MTTLRGHDYAILAALESVALRAHNDGRENITVGDIMRGMKDYQDTATMVRRWREEDEAAGKPWSLRT